MTLINTVINYSFWGTIVAGNAIQDYAIALGLFLIYFAILYFIFLYLFRRAERFAKKTQTEADDVAVSVVRSIRPPFYTFIAFYFALESLVIPVFLHKAVVVVLWIWIVMQLIAASDIIIEYLVSKRLHKEHGDRGDSAAKFLNTLVKIILWAIGLLLILSNLGVNITSLIAGLGIGGVAIAFALQNILADLFSSFAIYFDKPFVPGDFIVVGDKMGVVEKVGIKTTRVRALQGEELVMSNRELTSATVQNFKKMAQRRVVMKFGVVYETASADLEKIPSIIKDIIEKEELAKFDRAHFHKFSDSSLDFEVVYYVLSSEYSHYMDVNQNIHFAVKREFEKEKISMAYPTQTLYVQK